MSDNIIEPWQKMMADWQKTQASMTEQMVENMQKWLRSFEQDDSSFYSNNPVLDIYQGLIQKFLDHNPQFNLQHSNDWQELMSTFPGSGSVIQQMNELVNGSKALFDKLKEDFINHLPNDATRDYFLNTLDEISNPYSWLTFSGTEYDEGIKRFSEGPVFSGISDIDNRIAKAMDGWLELGGKNQDYYEILLKNWMSAYDRFLEHVQSVNASEDNELTPRKLIELWLNIANEELMTMHRSDEFLRAQRELIKASSEYRLYEQDIAEVVCDALHIPTRKEVDDLHKTITELRREVRALKNSQTTVKGTKKATKKTKAKAASK